MELEQVLAELEAFGIENDNQHDEYAKRMMNIPPATGQFLQVLALASRAKHILEVGTSNGYSTLWLGRAARALGGHVTTIEKSNYKIGLARANFERAGMNEMIIQVQMEGGEFMARATDSCFDFIFLDSARSEYPDWWPHIKRILVPGGLIVADNALSHVDEMRPFTALVESDPDFTTCVAPVGNGEYVAVKVKSRG